MAGDKGIGESSGAVSESPNISVRAGSRTVFLSYASRLRALPKKMNLSE
jgi:hypothetical protein